MLGDQDGVVVVAREALESVVGGARRVKVKEEKMEKAVADGARLPPGLEEIIAEKGVRYLD